MEEKASAGKAAARVICRSIDALFSPARAKRVRVHKLRHLSSLPCSDFISRAEVYPREYSRIDHFIDGFVKGSPFAIYSGDG